MFGGFSVAHLHFLYVRNKHFLATTTTSPATTAFLIVSSHGNECVFCGRLGVCWSAPPEHAGKGKAQMCCIKVRYQQLFWSIARLKYSAMYRGRSEHVQMLC
jgi:hypothetical protein